MGILYGLLIGSHVLVSLLLIVLILVQPGKSGGMGAAFGGGSSTSVFGGRGATTFLTKATGVLAALFFILSILIALTNREPSVTSDLPKKPVAAVPAPAPAPAAAPAPAPAAPAAAPAAVPAGQAGN